MPKPSKRARGYCFTWNNWGPEAIATLDSLEARYLCYGKEIAPDTGTPHLQGYLYWENGKTFSATRKKLLGAHVSIALGTPDQNRTYCSKAGDFVEFGVLPSDPEECGRNEIDRWSRARAAAQRGLMSGISGINIGMDEAANMMDAQAIQSGVNLQATRQALQNLIYQNAMARQAGQNQIMGSAASAGLMGALV